MSPTPTSPRIADLTWGSVEVEGHETVFKDAKLYPGGARAWDWTETGTHHEPGIQPADVEELLDNGAEVVVLSRGQQKRLQVMPDTVQHLSDRGVEVHILETKDAVAKYNELAKTERVGALIHSTC